MAEAFAALLKLGIRKTVLHGGKGETPSYDDGTKIYFHYRTTKCDEERTVIDDSHTFEKPMEIILGKKFKLEVWEAIIKTMKEDEVSEFIVETKHVSEYPVVSKSLREIFGKEKSVHHQEVDKSHCCGMMNLAERGVGYPDLDELIKNPQPLIFKIARI